MTIKPEEKFCLKCGKPLEISEDGLAVEQGAKLNYIRSFI